MSSSVHPPAAFERRHHVRRLVPSHQSIAWLRRGHHLYPAQVIDESTHGIGLILKQSPPFQVGQVISLEWLRKQLETFAGVIRSIDATAADSWRIGIEWSD
jgi:hypothetical protein